MVIGGMAAPDELGAKLVVLIENSVSYRKINVRLGVSEQVLPERTTARGALVFEAPRPSVVARNTGFSRPNRTEPVCATS